MISQKNIYNKILSAAEKSPIYVFFAHASFSHQYYIYPHNDYIAFVSNILRSS